MIKHLQMMEYSSRTKVFYKEKVEHFTFNFTLENQIHKNGDYYNDNTFLHSKEGCQLDFSDDNNAYMIYFVSFLGSLAVLPGNIVSALLLDKIGRLRMLAGSSTLSCISCFFVSFGNNESAMIALLCLFGGVSIASWNALDVITVELYPSDK
eukprot:g31331.t1